MDGSMFGLEISTDDRIPLSVIVVSEKKGWVAWHLDMNIDFKPIKGSPLADVLEELNNEDLEV